jgi:enterochelin esterase-like enzyme
MTSVIEEETASATHPVQSPRLRALTGALSEAGVDRKALLDGFWEEMRQAGTPLVEPIPGNEEVALVTFLWRETEPTGAVRLSEPVSWRSAEERELAKLEGTDVWFLTWRISVTLRAAYGFAVAPEGAEIPDGKWPQTRHDPLNKHLRPSEWEADQIDSVLVMPQAEPLPWDLADAQPLQGALHARTFASDILGNERPVWVYTPPDFSPDRSAYPLVVIFDGEEFHSTPRTLDAMIVAGALPPVVAVLVNQIDIRNEELPCNPEFSRMVATELVPWMRQEWNATDDPSRTVLNGCSFGGLCAAYTALKHPDVVGNVVMQSPSCWYHPSVMEAFRNPVPSAEAVVGIPAPIPTIVQEFRTADPVPVRIYHEVGNVENGPPPAQIWQVFGNRWLHDILVLKGYDTLYREFGGGHDDAWWRGTFADGMRWALTR